MNDNPKLRKLENELSSYMFQIKQIVENKHAPNPRSALSVSGQSRPTPHKQNEDFISDSENRRGKKQNHRRKTQNKGNDIQNERILASLKENLRNLEKMQGEGHISDDKGCGRGKGVKGNVLILDILEQTIKQFDGIKENSKPSKERRRRRQDRRDHRASHLSDSDASLSFQNGKIVFPILSKKYHDQRC